MFQDLRLLTQYQIHKDVLSFYAPRLLLQREDEALCTFELTLNIQSSHDTFKQFVHWLYTRGVPEGSSHDTSSSTGELCTRSLCMLWVFGASYTVPQLQNDMVTKIVERVMHSPWKDPSWHTTFVYKRALGTQLQSLIIDLIAASIGSAATNIRKEKWSDEARSDLATAIRDGICQPKDLANWDLRRYQV